MIRSALLVGFAAVVLAGCAADDVPRVPTDGLDPALADLLDRLVAEARSDRSSAEARGRLGMAYQANLLFDPAFVCYEQARQRDPDDPRWWYHAAIAQAELGELAPAQALMDSALVRDPDYPVAWVRSGEWHLADGDLEAAERAFRRATELRRNHPGGWLGLARIHLQRGEPEAAEQLLLDAIERRPHGVFVPYLRQLLGIVYRQTGRLQEAEEQIRQGQSGKPEWIDPWKSELDGYLVGLPSRLEEIRVTLEIGRGEESIAELEELLEENPTHARVLLYLGIAYEQAGHPARAREVLESAVEHHPDDGLAWENLADARARTGDAEGALEAANRAIVANPRRPSAYWRHGTYLARLGRMEEALAAFDRALAYEPTHAGALDGSARILLASGRAAEAAARWDRMIVADPTDANACVEGARAWALAGDPERARLLADRAEKLDPDHPALEQLRSTLQ